MINLLKITKGDWTVMDFLGEVEDQVELNRAEMKRITEDHLTRIALIAGFRDTSLSEKVLAENYNLKTKVQLAVTRENIKAKFWAVQGKSKVKVRRLGGRRKSKHHNGYDRDASSMDSRGNNIDDLQRRLNVLKVKRHSKYSGRYKNESSGKSEGAGGGANAGNKCMNCNLTHHACKGREAGKTCYQCQGVGTTPERRHSPPGGEDKSEASDAHHCRLPPKRGLRTTLRHWAAGNPWTTVPP